MSVTDNTIILFGKYKGEKLVNVPAPYLMWLADQPYCQQDIAQYVQDNYRVLKSETKK